MDNGIYSVDFRNGNRRGSGIVVMRDSQANGGDASFTYSGRIERDHEDPHLVHGFLLIKQHAGSPGSAIVRGLSDYRLNVQGEIDKEHVTLHGSLPDHPGIDADIVIFGHRIRGLEDSEQQ